MTAPYVSFVDADDWVEITMLEDMLRAMEKTGVDVIIGQAGRDKGDGTVTGSVRNSRASFWVSMRWGASTTPRMLISRSNH